MTCACKRCMNGVRVCAIFSQASPIGGACFLHNSKRVATTNGTFNRLPSYLAIFRNVMSRGGQKVNLYLENMEARYIEPFPFFCTHGQKVKHDF